MDITPHDVVVIVASGADADVVGSENLKRRSDGDRAGAGLHDNIVREVVQRNPDIFEGLTTTWEAIWREGATSLRVDPVETGNSSPVRTQAQASTLFLNYSGVVAALL